MRKHDMDTDNDLDKRRRVADLTVAQLARLTGIPYQRLWLALTGGSRITVQESDRLEAVLRENENQA